MTSTTQSAPVDLVRNLYAAFARGDIAQVLAYVAPDCQWITPGEGIPNAGHYVGPAGAAQFFEKLAASEEVTRFEPREYFASGDSVVAHGYEECRMKTTGVSAATNWMMLFRVRDGLIVHFETFYDTYAYARAHRLT